MNTGNLKRWPKGVSGNPGGRPKTKILREYARKIIEAKDEKTKKSVAEELIDILLKYARKGSLGHWQQLLQLVESDVPGAGWHGSDGKLDADAVAKLITKLCR